MFTILIGLLPQNNVLNLIQTETKDIPIKYTFLNSNSTNTWSTKPHKLVILQFKILSHVLLLKLINTLVLPLLKLHMVSIVTLTCLKTNSTDIFVNSILFQVLMLKISSKILFLPSRNMTASQKPMLVNLENHMNMISVTKPSTQPTSIHGKDTLKPFTERSLDVETDMDTSTTSKLLLALTSKDSSLCLKSVTRSIGKEPNSHVVRHTSNGPQHATADCLLSYYFLQLLQYLSAIRIWGKWNYYYNFQ